MKVIFFSNAAEFRAWLAQHHATATELFAGFYKKGAKKSGLTYPEAVKEALCFGWIDGIVRRLDAESYQHRFTPRKPTSIWSNVNVAHVARLAAAGRMHEAGLAAFARRSVAKTGTYSFEQKTAAVLPTAAQRRFRANRDAWKFFQAQPPWYQRALTHKIASPKLAATRERWLARAITASAAGERLL